MTYQMLCRLSTVSSNSHIDQRWNMLNYEKAIFVKFFLIPINVNNILECNLVVFHF